MTLPTSFGPLEPLGEQAASDELRSQYEAYRTRHARRLVRMLPRAAIRPLYRRAIDAEFEGAGQVRPDPMEVLVRFCEQLLPLPPFETWVQDLTAHPVPHLHDLDDSADVPTARAPATMEARLFEYRDDPWVAHLMSFRDGEAWRGYIAFEERRSGQVHRTALIFRESDPADLRDRFLSFETDALEAFLRSALP